MKQLTVSELIAKLQAISDKSMLVMVEGCDCYGEAIDVYVQVDYVLIERNP